MNEGPLRTDQMIGEGFAYFRWHCLNFSWVTECRGINDDRPGFGIDGCAWIWKRKHSHG